MIFTFHNLISAPMLCKSPHLFILSYFVATSLSKVKLKKVFLTPSKTESKLTVTHFPQTYNFSKMSFSCQFILRHKDGGGFYELRPHSQRRRNKKKQSL